MELRGTPAVAAVVLALVLAGCGGIVRQTADVPDENYPTPDETPYVEPVSPPAEDVERPDDEDGLD